MKTVFYKHKIKKEPIYIILNTFKYKYNGVWLDAVLYADIDSSEVYGRTESGFDESFKLVEND